MPRLAAWLALASLLLLVAGLAPSSAATTPTFTAPVRVDDPKVSGTKFANEPATVVDKNNIRYVAYQGGSQLAVSTDGGRTWAHKGGAEALTKNLTGCTSAADIGDVELTTDQAGRTYFADLQVAVGIPSDVGLQAVVARSDDGFASYAGGCSSHQVFSVDREWMAAFTPEGKSADESRVYMTYHDFGPNTMWVNTSKDGGKTWGTPVDIITDPPAVLSSFCDTVPAGIAVDPVTGWVYVGWTAGAGPPTNAGTGCNYTQGTVFNHFFVALSKDEGATWTASEAFAGPDYTAAEPGDMSELFGSVAIDRAGGVHVAFPDFINGEFGVYVASAPKPVSATALAFGPIAKVNGPEVHTAYFSRLVAGDEGRLDLLYLGSPVKNVVATPANKLAFDGSDPALPNCTPEVAADPQNPHGVRFPGKPCQMPATAPWYLYMAQTLDGGGTWTNQKLRDDAMHTGDICTLGIFCLPGDNRDLADVNDIKIDATGAAQVAYTFEPPDGSRTEIDFQCQTGGPGLLRGVAVTSCLDAKVVTPGAGGGAAAGGGSGGLGAPGTIAATGRDPRLALAGAVLLVVALALRRRRRPTN
ncbi:MAG: repeat-like domain [Acidimicrobiaceae bacterium]|jgi:hypothetical protein|nr:repeat-like domain [Acidimicrobiaceae bacterium]